MSIGSSPFTRHPFGVKCCTVLLMLLVAGGKARSAGTPARATGRPNVLFIMVDEMRWDAMHCAGNPIVRTPNLDRLAAQGTRFATAYTCAPICTPSRYSFFTGRYAHVHGSTDNGTPPQPGQLLLPAILKHAGYQTAISGKLHFLPASLDYGFDDFWSFSREGPGKLPRWPEELEKKYGRAAHRLEIQPFPNDPLGRDLGKLTYPKEDSQTFWITDRAIDSLRQCDRTRPFFLFVSYLDPHSPSHLAEPYWSMYDPRKMPVPKIPEWVKAARAEATKRGGRRGRHMVGDEEIARAMTAAYYAKVTTVDDNVGRLLAKLEEMKLSDNTLIVFTADHGNMLADLGRWFKGVMYEGSTRIPLLVKAPAQSPLASSLNRGKVVSQIVENTDVMPTLCEMIGVGLPQQGIQGKSLVGLVSGIADPWKDRAFAERGGMMVRTPQYKLIRNDAKNERPGAGQYELYDLTKDPKEEHDLAEDPAYAKARAELAAQLEAWQKDKPAPPVIEGVPTTADAGPTANPKRLKRSEKRTPRQPKNK
jgi:choline-sulfatase